MTYKAKTLSGAQARVRCLEKLLRDTRLLLAQFDRERRLLARLSADTPQFSSPLDVWEAQMVRDRILSLPRVTP